MPTILNLAQLQTAHARFKDANGNPAPIQGDAVWEASDPSVLDFAVLSAQNLDVDFVPLAEGTATVKARGWSTDPNAPRIELSLDVQVVAAPAVGGSIVVDAPRAR